MILEKVVKSRGIDFEDKVYNDPNFYQFHDPFLMKGIALAVKRVLEAKDKNEKVSIYGDYDVDGVSGVTVLKEGLESVGIQADFIIPSRLLDGYGLSERLITELRDRGTNLIITVDTGISGKEKIEYAKSLGMDVIVIDHHLPDVNNFPNCIVVNPRQEECSYPFKELCGCAVAFKFIQALVVTAKADKQVLANIMDMVTLATIADVVPLLGENRSFVKYGLKRLREGRMRPGLSHLMLNANVKLPELSSTTIAFKVVPQINAIGRLADANKAVKLMLNKNFEETKVLANTLTASNESRREIQESQLNEAVSKIEAGASVNLIYLDYAHEGVIGIIAGRIREMTNRPTFIFTTSETDNIKASARSVESIHLYDEVIYSGADLVCESFGGHGGSCGLTVSPENFDELKRRLRDGFDKFKEEDFTKTKFPIIDVSVVDVTLKEVESLERLEPFGKDNPEPVFRIVTDGLADVKIIGKEKDTCSLRFDLGSQLEGIIFRSNEAHLREFFKDRSATYWFEGRLKVNTFRDVKKPQMVITNYWREEI